MIANYIPKKQYIITKQMIIITDGLALIHGINEIIKLEILDDLSEILNHDNSEFKMNLRMHGKVELFQNSYVPFAWFQRKQTICR